MECALCNVQYVGKSETAINIILNNHRKDINNPKSIPADLPFRKPGHSFNLYAHFTLIEQLSNIHTTDKDTLKFRLKRREDFWIKKLEALTPKGLKCLNSCQLHFLFVILHFRLQFGNETLLSNHVTNRN